MLETYKAILKGNRIEWSGDSPDLPRREQGVAVYVTILQPAASSRPSSDGKAMAQALEKLAASGPLSGISEPSAWQREQREDRVLPGRDD
ncbi:MAG: hypothetical protein L0229_05430 [Blastocatellia bacterium]|nr:hypothetical protein [Blastocatellia bacterium]